MTNQINPTILKNVLPEEEFNKLKIHALDLYEGRSNFESGLGRYVFGTTPLLEEIHNSILDLAKEVFKSDTILPAWSMMAGYTGPDAILTRHKDDNAATYHIDLCIFQTTDWPIGVQNGSEDKYYVIQENEALAMCGESQEHWRNPLNGDYKDVVFNAFLFFCEPDHWYFSEGPEYIERLRVISRKKKMGL